MAASVLKEYASIVSWRAGTKVKKKKISGGVI